jgi:alpha,alpha-trehalase
MAPTTFVDEHTQKPVDVDAATYYGGGEAYARLRTYSQVMHHLLPLVHVLTHFL